MEIRFAGQLDRKTLGRAVALHTRFPLWAQVAADTMVGIVGLGVLGNVASGYLPALRHCGFRGPQYVPLLAFVGLVVSIPLWIFPLGVWLQARQGIPARSGSISEDGVYLQTSQSKARLDWQAFVHYRRSGDMVLLYPQPALSHAFPRAFFASDADWQVFNRLVEANVPEASLKDSAARARAMLIVPVLAFAIGVASYLFG